MTPYLIAHKVRGEPAFDIAQQIECATCHGVGESRFDNAYQGSPCDECDGLGYWWIIPTSGHRAYPYWHMPLDALMHDTEESANLVVPTRTLDDIPKMPEGLPDHYPCNRSPDTPKLSDRIAHLFKKPVVPLRRI